MLETRGFAMTGQNSENRASDQLCYKLFCILSLLLFPYLLFFISSSFLGIFFYKILLFLPSHFHISYKQ